MNPAPNLALEGDRYSIALHKNTLAYRNPKSNDMLIGVGPQQHATIINKTVEFSVKYGRSFKY